MLHFEYPPKEGNKNRRYKSENNVVTAVYFY